MKKLAYLVPVLAVLALALTPAVFAQAPGTTITPTGGIDANNLGVQGTVTSTTTLVSTILGLINWVAWFVALVAVVFGLYAGLLFISAGGDDSKISKAKSILIYAVIGIAVAILAFSIVAISRSIVNF